MRAKDQLRPYQHRIATHLYEHDEAICIARMGGGKTAAALTAIAELIEHGVIRHALVIAPKRVARNVWPDEIAQWAHLRGLRCAVMDGSPAQRLAQLRDAGRRDITIIGLDNVQWLVQALADLFGDHTHPVYDLLVLDEVSRLRNPTGVRAQKLARIGDRFKMIWGLTGTLRPNSALDLYMPVRVITRGKLWGRSYYQWRKQYCYPTDHNGYHWATLPGVEDKLNTDIAPLIVTLAADEMPQMPELSILFDHVELPGNARAAYDRMERKLLVDDTIVAASAGVATGKLAQIANGFVYNDDKQTVSMHEAKREWLTDLVADASGPMLLVYEYLADLALMRDVVGDHLPYLGDGVTDAESDRHIKAWNRKELPFLALHPASGGHGLNLQHGGCDMAWLAPTWSPELWEQTIARLHRPGQTQPVLVRVCVASATVDTLKLDRVYHKMDAQAAFEAYLRGRYPALGVAV